MSHYWVAVVLLIAAPLLVYGLVTVGAQAYFRAKREHTRSLLKELGNDTTNHQPEEHNTQCHH